MSMQDSGSAQQAFEHAAGLENELATLLKALKNQNDPAIIVQSDIERKLAQTREAFEVVIFRDIEFAQTNNVLERMWRRQHQLIEQYRKTLGNLQQSVKKRPVEVRKFNTMFINFIKSAMKFWRTFIQRLSTQFDCKELDVVVQELKFETNEQPVNRQRLTKNQRELVVSACYNALIKLGDLSRYREMHGVPDSKKDAKQKKNWGPAIGYYNLAKQLLPDAGQAYNQLSVISMNDGNYLSLVYQLYRALSVSDPFEKTQENLYVCFRKILKAHENGELKTTNRRDEQVLDDLLSLFLRFHAQCFTGIEPAETESLKSEMLNLLTLAVKDRAVTVGVLNKIVLINISAEFHAAKQTNDNSNVQKSLTYLRLNIETFTSLLLVLLQELERVTTESAGDQQKHLSENLTAVARRMLPSLRLYSSWLLVDHETLTAQLADTSLNVQIKQLWQIYASSMSLLRATFPLRDLANVEYILEEDVEALGFQPFKETTIERTRDLKKLSTFSKESQRDHPNEEVLARILFLLEDVLELCTYDNVPITTRETSFAFDDGIITAQSSTVNASTEYPPITVKDIPKSKFAKDSNSRAPNSVSRAERSIPMGSVASEAVSSTMTTKLNAMVDDLVGPSVQVHFKREGKSFSDDDDEEEVVFKGKKRVPGRSFMGDMGGSNVDSGAGTGGTIRKSSAGRIPASIPQPEGTKSAETARELVNLVTNYTQSLAMSTPNTPRQSDAVAAATWDAPHPTGPPSSSNYNTIAPPFTQTPTQNMRTPQAPTGYHSQQHQQQQRTYLPESSIASIPSSLPSQGHQQAPHIRYSQQQHTPQNLYSPWNANQYGDSPPPPGQGTPWNSNR